MNNSSAEHKRTADPGLRNEECGTRSANCKSAVAKKLPPSPRLRGTGRGTGCRTQSKTSPALTSNSFETAFRTPQSTLRNQHSALRNQHSALRNPQSAIRNQQSALRNQHSALRTPQSTFRTPHSALRNQQSALRNPHSFHPRRAPHSHSDHRHTCVPIITCVEVSERRCQEIIMSKQHETARTCMVLLLR